MDLQGADSSMMHRRGAVRRRTSHLVRNPDCIQIAISPRSQCGPSRPGFERKLTKVIACVTAWWARNWHSPRDGDQDDARLRCSYRSGCWSDHRVGRSGAVRLNSEALLARVHVVKGHVAWSAWALNHPWGRTVGRDDGPVRPARPS